MSAMRNKLAVLALASLILSSPVLAQEEPTAMCGVPHLDAETARLVDLLLRPEALADVEPVRIPIAFHVITSGRQGRVANKHIRTLISRLNWAFRDTPYSFYLQRVDRRHNPAWYNDCGPGSRNEAAMKKRLARDPKRVINLYSCRPFLQAGRRHLRGHGRPRRRAQLHELFGRSVHAALHARTDRAHDPDHGDLPADARTLVEETLEPGGAASRARGGVIVSPG